MSDKPQYTGASEQGQSGLLWTIFDGDPFCSRRVASFSNQEEAREYLDFKNSQADHKSLVVTCVFCGMAYPTNTPTHGAEILTAHVAVCEKHPMKKVLHEKNRLRSALVGFVGADGAELEGMKVAVGLMPGDPETKMMALQAIQVLSEIP